MLCLLLKALALAYHCYTTVISKLEKKQTKHNAESFS